MLKQLYIKNYTLIDELSIEFDDGFSVITGETGAGKSIILGAIGLLLGNRADTKQVKAGQDRCIVEAHFDTAGIPLEPLFHENDIDYDPQDCIMRREINSNGKSRAFVNDTPTSLAVMRELGEHLVDIHSQHQNLLLREEDFQLSVIDIVAETRQSLAEYKQCYGQYQQALGRLNSFREEIARARDGEDFLRFQLNELESAQLQEGEQELLEEKSQAMTHSEDIKTALFNTNRSLNDDDSSVLNSMRYAAGQMSSIEKVFPAARELAQRLDSCYIEMKDIAGEIDNLQEQIDFDPRQLEHINQRLDLIYTLQKKHHVESIAELLDLQEELSKQLGSIDNGEEELKRLQKQAEELREKCERQAAALSERRAKAAKTIEQEMKKRLEPLGIPAVRFQVSISKKQLSANGTDKVAFLFSANKSTPLLPVGEIASGGEVSRVMLSLKAMIGGTTKLPTIIFDEIDTGVSGRVAEQMARIMHEMGSNAHQVISITHLPQIAAVGDAHYKVSKEETSLGTKSNMARLTPEERIGEIAQMLSGAQITEEAVANAKQLLKNKL